MPQPTLSETQRALAPELDERLGRIFLALCPLIAHHFLRHPWVHFSVTIPLCNRFARYARRLSVLMARIAAGHLPTPRVRASRRAARPPSPKPRSPIPTQFGWMLKSMGYHVALYRSHLERLLAEPGMADLVAAVPSAARIIRPLCHMLALPSPCKPPARHARAQQPPAPEPCPAPKPSLAPEPSPAALPDAPPPPVLRSSVSPFRSLTLKRERYICTHSIPS